MFIIESNLLLIFYFLFFIITSLFFRLNFILLNLSRANRAYANWIYLAHKSHISLKMIEWAFEKISFHFVCLNSIRKQIFFNLIMI